MTEQPPEYLKRIPAQVPPGRVIVHNSVRPTRGLNMRGFRAWYEPAARADLIPCAPRDPRRISRAQGLEYPNAELASISFASNYSAFDSAEGLHFMVF